MGVGIGFGPIKEMVPISIGTNSLLYHAQEKAVKEIQQGKQKSIKGVIRVGQAPSGGEK
jgi:hypothetical protein